ncbi:Rab5 GDP/GTP exchange factor [Clonorchis sinensis]|uniref:Rab5 GDP/GTP exchange factor n=1 Tax=Clonorchis sinensis TaxID=79923 RepID=G7YBQ1_CLOSI|nr:Rab5 GDP/GTP exchange factor [Clonorchis sinensis]
MSADMSPDDQGLRAIDYAFMYTPVPPNVPTEKNPPSDKVNPVTRQRLATSTPFELDPFTSLKRGDIYIYLVGSRNTTLNGIYLETPSVHRKCHVFNNRPINGQNSSSSLPRNVTCEYGAASVSGVQKCIYVPKRRREFEDDGAFLPYLVISKLLEELETMGGSHIDQYSLVIQNFYQNMADRISKSPLYSGLLQSTSDKLMSAIERFLTTWIYCWAFASPITDDESVDLKLQEKIRSLHWITPSLLDSPINPRSPAELAALDNATFALIRVNALYASEDKLDQITECCLHVFEALKQHYEQQHQQSVLMKLDKFAGTPNTVQQTLANEAVAQPVEPNLSQNTTATPTRANADDFLPTLIWVVVKANPPLLHSNLQFIMRFANQKRLNSGQAGYFFTNLSCAVHFLTNLTHESLNMTEQEFYRCMRTGIPLNRRSGKQCEGEQLLTDNEIRLLDLEERFTDFEKQIDSMEKDMKQFDMLTKEQISHLRTNYPVNSLADKLDPRQLENPFVLLLGPPPVPQQPDESIQGLPSTSLLDLEDESTARLLPSPIEPSPYVPTSQASSASKSPS